MNENRGVDARPLISVVIPAYNCRETIFDTVHSVLESGLDRFEVVLIDDGSSDETPEICDRICVQEDRVRCIHQKNSGVSAARNRGLSEAGGEYVLFFDADDTVDQGAFSGMEELLAGEKPDMLLFGMSFDYYRRGTRYQRTDMTCGQEGRFSREQFREWIPDLYDCNYLSSACNKFIRRTMIEEHSLRFDEDMFLMEDCLFSLRCLSVSSSIYLVPRAIYRYRQREDEQNGAKRIAMIPSLTAYMGHFRSLPKEYGAVVNRVYYTLLWIAVERADLKRLKALAEDHDRWTMRPASAAQSRLDGNLKERKLLRIRARTLKTGIRHRIAVIAKAKGWYKES